MTEKLTTLLKESFYNDILFKKVFDGNEQAMKSYIKCSLEVCETEGGVISIEDSAVITWIPDKVFPPSIPEGKLTEEDKKNTDKFELHEHTPESIISASAKNFGYIWFLAVSPTARGKGYAKQLINQAVQAMQAKGLTECWLSTENPKNKEFYSHNGFVLHKEQVSEMGIKTMVYMKKI